MIQAFSGFETTVGTGHLLKFKEDVYRELQKREGCASP
ncbi:hypothetical protein FHS19_001779 [Paenibacillus rhizosphaerae]|jgi:hypothetical protein|uniref:Uncharacterized protein n=2 Tax=Paenibacillus TaxID=44249 RepID=A0A839TJZ9_9BACL|nr:hypothetical protein [Paenibacillus rhizosphaerae]RED38928.1 hypothetical protein C7820_0056 [Paenibacillus sp. VMFN-D1]